jgi:CRP-like cAMP-binding protein
MNARAPTNSFDVEAFLGLAGRGCTITRLRKGDVVYSQATVAKAIYYLKSGKIKIGVTSPQGKEAVLAMLEPGSFFGEGCLRGEEDRLAAAVAIVESEVLRVPKAEMLRLLDQDRSFAGFFMKHLLLRNQRIEEDLVDQLFNSSEKRLARALLILAKFDKEDRPQPITRLSQETLAEMVGTTRPRVSHFMNKFRRLGYISYDGGLRVHRSLLTVLLQDSETAQRFAQSSSRPAPGQPNLPCAPCLSQSRPEHF